MKKSTGFAWLNTAIGQPRLATFGGIAFLMLFAASAPSLADQPAVVAVTATPTGASFRFDVTLRHADGGWDHYADRWDIETSDGELLGSRVLYHPHVNEQPFTRSLSGIVIPTETTTVVVRPHDSVHGDGALYSVELPGR